MTLIDRLWMQAEPAVFISREQFERDLEGWTVTPVEIDGQLAFATVVRGAEFHFASFGTGAPISLKMIRAHIDPIIAAHGFVTTRTPRDGADRQHRINKLLGFAATGGDEFFIHYRKGPPCP